VNALRAACPVAAAILLGGCSTAEFYWQGITGELDLLARARAIPSVLESVHDPVLRHKLERVLAIRDFASRDLGLPDNLSYRRYTELDRRFVTWNVFAAPPLSLDARQWCFPIAGCVNYRGYFAESDARREAAGLAATGDDVYVGGVPAYSTLGWFDDPLLSTFIRYPDAQLARLLFHELSHQVAYAKGDTTFNESFAVTVEQEGVKRWLAAEGRSSELDAFHARQRRQREFAERVSQVRERLALIYKMDLSPEAKLENKRGEWQRLRQSYPGVPAEPNNAFLASIATYTELVPAFERLLAETGGDLPAFYKRVKELAAKPSEREAFARTAGYRRSS
jgi:predicted aminopeptidase